MRATSLGVMKCGTSLGSTLRHCALLRRTHLISSVVAVGVEPGEGFLQGVPACIAEGPSQARKERFDPDTTRYDRTIQ